jgi:hypothetical protein
MRRPGPKPRHRCIEEDVMRDIKATAIKHSLPYSRVLGIRQWVLIDYSLTERERRLFSRYLNGGKTCAEFDVLPDTVKAAVDAYETRLEQAKASEERVKKGEAF